MKPFLLLTSLLISVSAFASNAPVSLYVCKAPNLTVVVNAGGSTFTVTRKSVETDYVVTGITSQTGDTDQTYESAEGVKVTIDDQYGDSLIEADGATISLDCR